MRMSNSSMMFGGIGSLDAMLTKLQMQTQQAIEKTQHTASFAETLSTLQGVETAQAAAETKSTADMTMEEYQEYIWNKIETFPFHPTRPFDEQTIKIQDKCWERMKNDPEYEEKMMNIIKEGRMYPNPFYAMGDKGAYEVLEFDGGEGCYPHTWSKNFGGSSVGARKRFETESKSAESARTMRAKRAKQRAEADEKYYAQKRLLEKMSEQLAAIRSARARQAGLSHTASDMPIFGIPAEFLLAGLGGGMDGMTTGL